VLQRQPFYHDLKAFKSFPPNPTGEADDASANPRICPVGGRSVLAASAAWWCRRLGCPLSVAGASTSLLVVFGMVCLKTLPRRRRYQHSGVV